MNYKTRPKINPKIVFNNILPNTKKSLIIGKNNSDIIEILKSKKNECKEFQEENEKSIIDFLNQCNEKEYDLIIFNFELCNYHNLKTIINLFLNKSKYSIIRFRNYNVNNVKITKKDQIHKIIKSEKINVFKKFYVRKNFFTKNILFKPFSYCSVYFITKNEVCLNFEMCFIDKIKKFLFSRKENEKLVINKK